MTEYNNVPGRVEFLDLKHQYLILVPRDERGLNLLYDGHIYTEKGEVSDKFYSMRFNEKQFLLMEKYLFNFICLECDLIITMYEEEWVEGDKLITIQKLTEKALNVSDDEKFIELAKQLLNLVRLAIELKTSLVFYF